MGLRPNAELEPMAIDLTRSSFSNRVTATIHPDVYGEIVEGMWMVHTRDGKYIRPSSGKPYETLAGVASLRTSPDTASWQAVLLTGEFRVYTLCYADGPWTATNKTIPILGPNGEVMIGKFPRDLPIAVGRVICVPDDDEPYLGITGRAFG